MRRKNVYRGWVAGVVGMMISVLAGAGETVDLDMFLGELKLLRNVEVERVAVGNGTLVEVQVLPGRQILLIAEGVGSTSIHLWHKDGTESDYNLRIVESDPRKRVRLEKMIKMDVQIVEFRKAALDKLGINWDKEIQGPGVGVAGTVVSSDLSRSVGDNAVFAALPDRVRPFQGYFGIVTEIRSRINYLASNGDATTLAEPTLSCRNGGTAKFLAGGEVPYPVVGRNGQTRVEFKEYGIKLHITPVVDDSGVIAADILTEVSQIDQSVNVLGSPGLLTRKTETQMNVRAGETIVIAGLLNRERGLDHDQIAGLGDIPILGWLFKSRNFRNNVSELVIFVTPRVVDARGDGNIRQIEQTRTRIEESFGISRRNVDDEITFGLFD